jgi:mitosis inhibitor protein kinase SWE1
LITFEGVLKIGDFGLATDWPVLSGVPQEGDREYMGPEILEGIFDKPADIFSLGLITLEIAANVSLPNNGASWTALRSGDFRDVPTLTTGTGAGEATVRSSLSFEEALSGGTLPTLPAIPTRPDFGTPKNAPLSRPPPFMANASHAFSLDQLVRDLTRPNPKQRPTVEQILELESIRWVASRRRGAATVYEGPWGPDDVVTGHVVADVDTEMMDA